MPWRIVYRKDGKWSALRSMGNLVLFETKDDAERYAEFRQWLCDGDWERWFVTDEE